ncbi:ParA family protein [Acidovorax sp. ST3]|uniref:ParA family protein n=1 Tax=Acidovorax sp. ST3 TaxID=2219062 RepID=UPI00137AB72D|nr:ParA family protein [Acidovorax sp. ST3]
MTKSAVKKSGVVVSVLNMKGGVGKTTISAHVFRHLYRHLLKSTVLLDFDPQFNLTQTITTQADYEKLKAAKKTVLSVMEDHSSPSIFKTSASKEIIPKLDDVAVKLRQISNNTSINLSFVPGDFDIVKYALITDPKVLDSAKQRFMQFVSNARQEKDVVCIDCNPSSSFMTTCALEAATHVLVPVRPDRYSLLGLKLLDQFISDLPAINPKPKLIVLLNGVKTHGYDPIVENTLRSDPKFGAATMAATLQVSKLLEASQGYTGFATDKKQSWRVTPQITKIVDELGKALGL